jgi:ubiquinone/menaquinone biosynthesis C-methylase UbiE
MNVKLPVYGTLCSMFYDATKKYAPESEVAFYASFINPQQRVLEAMSGSGRLQIPLLERGYMVDGVDNSPIMLDRCRKRCADLGLTPELYEQSLENLHLPHCYGTVTIAVGSFQLIVNRIQALQALKNIRAHMFTKGTLLIDIFVPDSTSEPRSVRIARINSNTIIRLTTRYIFYEQEKRADAFCLYELIVNGEVQQQEDEVLQITWYANDELQQLLNDAGFEVITIYEKSFRSSGPSHIVYAQAF